MKKVSKFAIFATIALIFSLVSLPSNTAYAAMADGTHNINYEIQEAGGGGASIADGYFTKPAKLTVDGNTHTIELTVTSAEMIKSLSVQGTPVNVVSDSGDSRTVKFNVSDASKPVNLDMHVIVPDLYDQDHKAQAHFDVSGIPEASSDSNDEQKSEEPTSNNNNDNDESTNSSSNNDENEVTAGASDNDAKKDVENPPTGDDTPIALYIGLLVGSIILFAVYRFRFARN